MAFLGVQYKLKTSDNFEDYMKFLGVGMVSRKTAASLSPVASLVKNDDGSYTYNMTTAIRSEKTNFNLGVEFTAERLDGDKVKTTMTLEGNILTEIQVDSKGRVSKHVREFTPETMVATTTAEGWDGVCVRSYVAVK